MRRGTCSAGWTRARTTSTPARVKSDDRAHGFEHLNRIGRRRAGLVRGRPCRFGDHLHAVYYHHTQERLLIFICGSKAHDVATRSEKPSDATSKVGIEIQSTDIDGAALTADEAEPVARSLMDVAVRLREIEAG
jgi:hypothetical protein